VTPLNTGTTPETECLDTREPHPSVVADPDREADTRQAPVRAEGNRWQPTGPKWSGAGIASRGLSAPEPRRGGSPLTSLPLTVPASRPSARRAGPDGQGYAVPGLTSPTVVFDGVGTSFDGRRVLRNVSLRVAGGSTTALMGQSGSGKSVLARHLAGELVPSEGRVLVAGEAIWDAARERRAVDPRRFGVLFGANQSYDDHIDRSRSVLDNLTAVLVRAGVDPADAVERARAHAREWDLDRVADVRAEDVESITRHRLCLAQALVGDPPLVVIDDPSWAVDIHHVQDEVRFIRAWQRRTGGTILLTTHSIMFAKALAHQVAIMRGGEIVASGPTDEVLAGVDNDASFERRFHQSLSVRESDVERLRDLGTDNVRWGGSYLDIARPMRNDISVHRKRRAAGLRP
jgi:ABC-type multidrug transport system ATPase subunit